MTPNELPSEPRRGSWKRWVVAAVGALVIVMAVFLLSAPIHEAVSVWFVRSTNEVGEKQLVFKGTNGFSIQILFYADVFTNAAYPTRARPRMNHVNGWTRTNVVAGTSFDFTLKTPTSDVPYYVVWAYHETGPAATRWEKVRIALHDFFRDHGMPTLSRRFGRTGDAHSIASTEIKE